MTDLDLFVKAFKEAAVKQLRDLEEPVIAYDEAIAIDAMIGDSDLKTIFAEAFNALWRPIAEAPEHDGRLVIYQLGEDRFAMGRADDAHHNPPYLDGATHFQFFPSPPKK